MEILYCTKRLENPISIVLSNSIVWKCFPWYNILELTIASCEQGNTLLLIPNEFGTVFEFGVQRLETSEEQEIKYSQALAKPERENISHNTLLEALTFKATRISF